jgi:hypothetical protein
VGSATSRQSLVSTIHATCINNKLQYLDYDRKDLKDIILRSSESYGMLASPSVESQSTSSWRAGPKVIVIVVIVGRMYCTWNGNGSCHQWIFCRKECLGGEAVEAQHTKHKVGQRTYTPIGRDEEAKSQRTINNMIWMRTNTSTNLQNERSHNLEHDGTVRNF